MGIIELWTIVAVVLHFCGVGCFAEWQLIAGPFTWSCMCLEIWVFMLYALLAGLLVGIKIFSSRL